MFRYLPTGEGKNSNRERSYIYSRYRATIYYTIPEHLKSALCRPVFVNVVWLVPMIMRYDPVRNIGGDDIGGPPAVTMYEPNSQISNDMRLTL